MAAWGLAGGTVAALGLLLVAPLLPDLFTADADVQSAAVRGLVVAALIQPLSGVVFVLDGVLIGAGDGRYLAVAGLLTALVYLPAAWAVVSLGGGIGALWGAYGVWILARAATLVIRARGDRWLRTGAVLGGPGSGP
jgi:Na+-driven multidrug efflux pump